MYSDRLIEQTIATWQPLSSTPLTREGAREMISNVVGLLELLASWDCDPLAAQPPIVPSSESQSSPCDSITPSKGARAAHDAVAPVPAEALHA